VCPVLKLKLMADLDNMQIWKVEEMQDN
jgi:hypothetical protein